MRSLNKAASGALNVSRLQIRGALHIPFWHRVPKIIEPALGKGVSEDLQIDDVMEGRQPQLTLTIV